MRIAVVYIFPNEGRYEKLAKRFVSACEKYPVGAAYQLYVVLNGCNEVTDRQRDVFASLSPKFIFHDNFGKDIGAYQLVAGIIACDLMVCMGAPVRPCHIGWLDCMVAAVEGNGPGLYGCWGLHVPRPHLRTTLFWTMPEILNAYPERIQNNQRYEFEFGANGLSQFCMKEGFPVRQVTRLGVFETPDWHHVDREDCIALDQHCDNLGYKD